MENENCEESGTGGKAVNGKTSVWLNKRKKEKKIEGKREHGDEIILKKVEKTGVRGGQWE